MSRQVPASYPHHCSGSPRRDSYTGPSEYRTHQNASTGPPSNQHRPLTAKLKSMGVSANSILYRIARRIEKLDAWSTSFGRRWENRHSGEKGDGRSYGRKRRSDSVGGSHRQWQGQRDQGCTSLGRGREKTLQYGHERKVSSVNSKTETRRQSSSRPRVTAVKSYVSDPESRDISNDSDAANFRRKMGIDTPPHSLSPSAQNSIQRHPGVGPTSVVGHLRDATRPETASALRPTIVDTNGARQTAARQSRNQTTSHPQEQGQDRHETRRTVNDAQLPRRRRTKHGRSRSQSSHASVSPLIYGK